jgi:hypothetical protein
MRLFINISCGRNTQAKTLAGQSHNQVQQVTITPVKGLLLGSKGVKILFGIITQVEEGPYYLDDKFLGCWSILKVQLLLIPGGKDTIAT